MAVPEYTPGQWVQKMHGIQHLTYKFATLSANETSGAGLEPWEMPYLGTIYFFGGVGAVGLVLSLLVMLLATCCCMCCKNCCRSRMSYRYVTRPPTYLKVMVCLKACVLMLFAGGMVWASMKAEHGFNQGTDAVDQAVRLFDDGKLSLLSLKDLTSNIQQNVQSLEDDTQSDPNAPRSAMTQLSTVMQSFTQTTDSLLADLPSLSSEEKILHQVEHYGPFYFYGSLGLAGALVGAAVLVMAGTCCRSRCALGAGAALAALVLFIVWVLVAALFPAMVVSSDFCVDPDGFLQGRITDEYLNDYINCSVPSYTPLQDLFDQADLALASADQQESELQLYSYNSSVATELVNQIGQQLQQVKTTVGSLHSSLECSEVKGIYVNALNGMCGTFVWPSIVMLGLLGHVGVLLTILYLMITRLWARVKITRYGLDDDDYDHSAEDRRPLLRSPNASGGSVNRSDAEIRSRARVAAWNAEGETQSFA